MIWVRIAVVIFAGIGLITVFHPVLGFIFAVGQSLFFPFLAATLAVLAYVGIQTLLVIRRRQRQSPRRDWPLD